ncbi:hypothetical protein J2X16_004397 [Pelomonas aquatica]|uniref:Uncharacterized protein n=1 Tax=Pelomonas aquatica TaxID=431058 RepID=A0ABU1ZEH8_9BURK|nr:hypothetical protein [Pelomonas aquatica]
MAEEDVSEIRLFGRSRFNRFADRRECLHLGWCVHDR